jgi:predicted TIM-barrel fold metal-dependent hydrolase
MIIDIHTHVGDCILGGELNEPYEKPPRLLSNLFEASNFRLMGGKKLFPRFSHYIEIIHNQERSNLGTVENLLRYMDLYGISTSVLQPIEPYRSTESNLEVVGERLMTFASVHPGTAGWENRLKIYMDKGCLGLKIHPIIQGLAPDNLGVFNLFEEYAPYGRPVLLHAGESSYRIGAPSASRLGRIVDWAPVFSAFPEIRFIIAHMAMEGWRDVLELAEKYTNLYTDTSFQPVSHVREALRRMGGDRVLFASDWPFSLQEAPLRVIDAAAADDQGLHRALLRDNATSLLVLTP